MIYLSESRVQLLYESQHQFVTCPLVSSPCAISSPLESRVWFCLFTVYFTALPFTTIISPCEDPRTTHKQGLLKDLLEEKGGCDSDPLPAHRRKEAFSLELLNSAA